MQSYLFNILQTVRTVRDYLVASGPQTLRSGADVLAMLGDGMRRAADYVEQFGPLVQFQRGQGKDYHGGVDSDEAQAALTELTAIRDEAEKHLAALQTESQQHNENIQKQLAAGVNAGLLDWIGKIDPATKAAIWSMLLSLLTKVLAKSGATPGAATSHAGRPTVKKT